MPTRQLKITITSLTHTISYFIIIVGQIFTMDNLLEICELGLIVIFNGLNVKIFGFLVIFLLY